MKLTLLPEAELEATEASLWYEGQREGPGGDFLVELRRALDRIRRDPHGATLLESYTGPYQIRRLLLKRFAYLVIYTDLADETLLVAATHARREPFYWLYRLSTE